MQDIAIQPTMRMLWRAMKLFRVPITHEYIQNLTEFDLEFIEMSTALDDPKLREKILNTVYDEEFDDYANEVEENDDLTEEERKMMEEIMSKQKSKEDVEDDGFVPIESSEEYQGEDPDDWEDVD